MRGRAGRIGRLVLVPMLVLSAEVGVSARQAAHPPAAQTPPPAAAKTPPPAPASTAKPPAQAPAAPHATPTAPATPVPAAKAPIVKTPPVSDLKGALDRIQQRVAAKVGPAATPQIAPNFPGLVKRSTPAPAARAGVAPSAAGTPPAPPAIAPPQIAPPAIPPPPVAKPAAAQARPATPVPSHIQLSWRTSLAWPTLVTTPAPRPAVGRIMLIWR